MISESTQRDVQGIVGLCTVLEMLQHLRLVGVLDLQPFALCVVRRAGFQIYLKNARCVDTIRADLWNHNVAAVFQGNENLVLIAGVGVRYEWS